MEIKHWDSTIERMRVSPSSARQVAGYAAEFRLSAGLTDSQVLQRNAQNTADISIGGTARWTRRKNDRSSHSLERSKPVKGWTWKPVATVHGDTWTGTVPGVPMGGPYTIEFRSSGATPVVIKDMLVGDLWILAGQSNMEGVGDLENVQPPDPRVHSFDQLDRWGVAQEPLHNLVGPSIAFTGAIIPRHGSPARRSSRSIASARRALVSACRSRSRWSNEPACLSG